MFNICFSVFLRLLWVWSVETVIDNTKQWISSNIQIFVLKYEFIVDRTFVVRRRKCQCPVHSTSITTAVYLISGTWYLILPDLYQDGSGNCSHICNKASVHILDFLAIVIQTWYSWNCPVMWSPVTRELGTSNRLSSSVQHPISCCCGTVLFRYYFTSRWNQGGLS